MAGAFSSRKAGEVATMLVFLQKFWTESAEEKRAVRRVGSTWLGPAN